MCCLYDLPIPPSLLIDLSKCPVAAGDRAVNVLWRLQNGEGPWGLDVRCVTVLIGTNDLGRNYLEYKARAAQSYACIWAPLQA